MKRIVTLLLALLMVLSLCACGSSAPVAPAAPAAGDAGSEKEAPSEEIAADPDAEAYKAALALMDEGKYEDAIAAFSAIEAYEDSAAKLQECRDKLTQEQYSEANALMAEEKYVEAGAIFKTLGDFEDSADKLEECRKYAPYELTNVGDHIFFGKYEQDVNRENGPEPLEWRVLDKQDGKLLIITEKLIDEQPFYAINWKHSYIGGFLNSSFLNDFTPEEKEMLVKITVMPHPHPDAPDAEQGSPVEQKVFLLSLQEAEQYFADDEDRICGVTAYTNWFGEFGLEPDEPYSWWLRTSYWTGSAGAVIASVDAHGRITTTPQRWNCCLRPACWIQLVEN